MKDIIKTIMQFYSYSCTFYGMTFGIIIKESIYISGGKNQD